MIRFKKEIWPETGNRPFCSVAHENAEIHNFLANRWQQKLPDGGRNAVPGAMKYWEIIADRLSKSGWSWGAVTAVKDDGKPVFIAAARSADDKHFIVRADEKLTVFLDREEQWRNDKTIH